MIEVRRIRREDEAAWRAMWRDYLAFYATERRIEPVCCGQDLFVAPDSRSAGVGAVLIAGAYVEADAAGCGDVHWLTPSFNATARRLCDRIGVATPFVKYRRGDPA